MTYLGRPRLHFSGRYLADPPTGNNRPANRENPALDQGGAGPALNLSWNPDGTHTFALEHVEVRSALGAGGVAPAGDVVLGARLAAAGALDAKLVDLDTDQQAASAIFGLDLALFDADENVLVRGVMDPVPFTDLWSRVAQGSDVTSTAAYHSTLTVVEWGDLSGSPFLTELRDATEGDLLSIKFNIDEYNRPGTPGDPDPALRRGRIVGTIGAATVAEPRYQIVGRQFGTMPFAAPGVVNYFPGVLDDAAGVVRLDLGNALPAVDPGSLDLALAYRDGNGAPVRIGPIDTRTADWYTTTAGVVDVPLGDTAVGLVQAHPLLVLAGPQGSETVLVEESPVHVRAEEFVHRLDPEEQWVVRLHVAERGRPLSGAQVTLSMRTSDPNGNPIANYPVHGLTFSQSVTTLADGVAEVTFTAADPGPTRFYETGRPRVLADGQVYRIDYSVNGVDPGNPSNFLSVLVWNTYAGDATWSGGIDRILRPYGRLYPVMGKPGGPAIDLTDCASVAEHHEAVLRTLTSDITDPRYMPVTRDLSGSRRDALVTWLTTLGPGGKPVCDAAGPPADPLVESLTGDDEAAEPDVLDTKTAAARRAGIAPP